MVWFMSHYVFNLEYSVKIREVALFVQEYIFGLPATSGLKQHKTATYLAVATDIQVIFTPNDIVANLLTVNFMYIIYIYQHLKELIQKP